MIKLKVGEFMFTIEIENNIILLIFLVLLLISIVVMYYIKRKFDSIDKYNDKVVDKLKTYKENQIQYKQNLKDIGLSNKEIKIIEKIIKLITQKSD